MNVIKTRYGHIPVKELTFLDFPEGPASDLPQLDLEGYKPERVNSIIYYRAGSSHHLIKIPNKLTPKLSYLVGYFYGDAGFKDIKQSKRMNNRYEYKIIVADEFKGQIVIIKNLLKELFNLKTKIRNERVLKGENCYYINPTCKVVYKFLTRMFDFPEGPKTSKIQIPERIKENKEMIRWFLRGFLDAEGDTRAVESFKIKQKLSSPRIKVRIADANFIYELKDSLNNLFNLGMTGPYFDSNGVYIQCAWSGVKKANKNNLFFHPIKKWRLNKFVEIKNKK